MIPPQIYDVAIWRWLSNVSLILFYTCSVTNASEQGRINGAKLVPVSIRSLMIRIPETDPVTTPFLSRFVFRVYWQVGGRR